MNRRFDELRRRFSELARFRPRTSAPTTTPRPISVRSPDYLHRRWLADWSPSSPKTALPPKDVFYNYYVFEHPGDPRYLILRAPVPAAAPHFPSLAAESPP